MQTTPPPLDKAGGQILLHGVCLEEEHLLLGTGTVSTFLITPSGIRFTSSVVLSAWVLLDQSGTSWLGTLLGDITLVLTGCRSALSDLIIDRVGATFRVEDPFATILTEPCLEVCVTDRDKACGISAELIKRTLAFIQECSILITNPIRPSDVGRW